jgi:hypothetical protein
MKEVTVAQLSKTDQKRISFLSIYATLDGDYDASLEVLEQMDKDGLFDSGNSSGRSSGRSGRSGGRGSGSKSSKRSSGGGNPQGEPTQKQVDFAIRLGALDDYSEDDLWEMTRGELSNLIEDYNND